MNAIFRSASVFAVSVLVVGVLAVTTVSAGGNYDGVGGYNPDADSVSPGAEAGVFPSTSPSVSGSLEQAGGVSVEEALEKSSGVYSTSVVCSNSAGTVWWVSMVVIAALLLWFGRRRGTYLWLAAIYALGWFLWAWKFCDFGYAWLPVLFAVIIWLLSVPRPGTPVKK